MEANIVGLKRTETTDLILIYSDVRFPNGAILTQDAYLEFLDSASRAEKQTCKASILARSEAAGMNLERFVSGRLH